MKIEKINTNKVKLILTDIDLEERKITKNDLKLNSKKTHDLFADLIDEISNHLDIIEDKTKLLIEANFDYNNDFNIFITKFDDRLFNIKHFYEFTNKYAPNNNIFEFDSIEKIFQLSYNLNKSDVFIGKNSLYKFQNQYFLIFSKYSMKNINFLKTYSILQEFSDNSKNSTLFELSIKEKSKLIIKDRAIQTIIKS
jgi:adapter protein MecA 1/2